MAGACRWSWNGKKPGAGKWTAPIRTGRFHGVSSVSRPGPGMEFFRIRDYIKGDPLRNINWKLLAKRQKLMVNDYEFGLVEKMTGWGEAEVLRHVKVLVVTRGDQGATIYADGKRVDVPAFPEVRIADPTGVGDAFRGGFLRGVASGWPWDLCGRLGALAATYCLEQTGPQNHHYTRAEFVARFRCHFDDNGLLDEMLTSPPTLAFGHPSPLSTVSGRGEAGGGEG